jgi:hypothetical protein
VLRCAALQAATIEAGEAVQVSDVPQDEFCCFRLVLRDRAHLLSVRLAPRPNAAGTPSDPDLYVSNKHAGLVAVDRDNYIWRSTNSGLDQVHIYIHYSRHIHSFLPCCAVLSVLCCAICAVLAQRIKERDSESFVACLTTRSLSLSVSLSLTRCLLLLLLCRWTSIRTI